MRLPKLCSPLSLRAGSLTVLIISLLGPLYEFQKVSLSSTSGIVSLVIHLLGLLTIIGCIYAFYQSSARNFLIGISFYLALSATFFTLLAISVGNDYSNTSAVVDRCFQDAKSSERFAFVPDADIRARCEARLPNDLTTITFVLVVIGCIIVYFNMVLIGFYRELAADPSKYASPWFTTRTTNTSSPNAGQYQLEEVHDPSPEYEPPLPPYSGKNSGIEQGARA